MKSGIYEIECLANGKKYIGSTCNLYERKRDHFGALLGNRHSNPHLQNAYNKYGRKTFRFIVLFYCDQLDLLFWEQKTIDYFDPKYMFNISVYAGSPMLGLHHTEETKKKIAKASLGNTFALGNKLTPEHKEKIRTANRGKKHTKETRKKMTIAQTGNKKCLGNRHSEETKKKMSESHMGNTYTLGYIPTAQHRARISAAKKGFKPSDESIKKMSETKRARGCHLGSKNQAAKLDEQQVILIRYLNKKYGVKTGTFMKSLNLSRTTIRGAITGRTWSHVPNG